MKLYKRYNCKFFTSVWTGGGGSVQSNFCGKIRQSGSPRKNLSRGWIIGLNWDIVLSNIKKFSQSYSQSPLLTDFTPPPPPLINSGLKLVCIVNIVYGSLKSENSQDYAQKSQRNCTFINSASVSILKKNFYKLGATHPPLFRNHRLRKFLGLLDPDPSY